MYNIAIQNESGYTFIVHNNPSVRSMVAVAKTLHAFRYTTDIDPSVFAAHTLLNIAGTDPKKRPAFHLGLRPTIGENHAAILAVSFVKQKVGWFHETGQPIRQYSFDTIVNEYAADPAMGAYTIPNHYSASTPPSTFLFS